MEMQSLPIEYGCMPKIGVHDGIHYAVGCNGGCGIVMMNWLGSKVALS